MAIAGRRTRKWCRSARRAAARARQNRLRGVEALLGPRSAKYFFRESWEQRPELYRRSCDASILASLPRWRDLSSIRRGPNTASPRHRHEGRRRVARLRVGGARVVGWMLVNSEPRGLCGRGVPAALGFTENAPASCLCSIVRHATACPSRRRARRRSRDVFVVQLEGKKSWVVYAVPPVSPFPNNDEHQAGKAFDAAGGL